MSRLPFGKPEKPGSTGAAAPSPVGALTVSQAAAMIDGAIRTGVPGAIRIVGEVSNFTDRTHWYFAVKDAECVLSCIMFGARARAAGFTPAAGQQVVITARAEFYKPQGRVTLNVERIEPVGVGALELQLKRLIEDVRALGWLDPERKRPLPRFPRRIAVVTSKTGAALQDVINTALRRCPAVELCFIDTLVQGAGAAPLVAAAINWVSDAATRLGIEAVIVTRGGGSMEDLWAFNERVVAEAIVKCAVPVVAAIGHETDTTVAELVADERCATPTQAAMRLTPDRASLLEQVEMVTGRLSGAAAGLARERRRHGREVARHLLMQMRERVSTAARRIGALGTRLERVKPAAVYERRRARLDAAALRLSAAVLGLARRERERLTGFDRQLNLVGPQAVLARGYSVTIKADGGVVREPTDVRAGDELITRLAEGSVKSVVKGSVPDALPAQRRIGAVRRPGPARDDGPGLFAS